MGIKWIGDFCPDGQPHYLIDNYKFDGGCLFRCIRCHQHLWLPILMEDATKLGSLINLLGAQAGYCKFLDKHRLAKMIMAKLQDLWRANQISTNKEDFLLKVLEIMKEKEYDREIA